MRLRDVFRRRPPREADELRPLSEADVRRLQRVQRATPKRVRVLRRDRSA